MACIQLLREPASERETHRLIEVVRDFLDWYKIEFPDAEPNVPDYVRLYVSESRAEEIARVDSYEILFTPYDWRLNDRVAG